VPRQWVVKHLGVARQGPPSFTRVSKSVKRLPADLTLRRQVWHALVTIDSTRIGAVHPLITRARAAQQAPVIPVETGIQHAGNVQTLDKCPPPSP
jgi:hypothetical protein